MAKKKRCKTAKKEDGSTARYVCKKCGQKAIKEKHLCKPQKK